MMNQTKVFRRFFYDFLRIEKLEMKRQSDNTKPCMCCGLTFQRDSCNKYFKSGKHSLIAIGKTKSEINKKE